MEPSQDWIDDCKHWYGEVLSGEGAHWCPCWDELPIDNTCMEMHACTCEEYREVPRLATEPEPAQKF